jgi:tight adherence protein B
VSPIVVFAMAVAGAGGFLFVWVGIELFSRGWTSYEEKYVKGAEKTLDSIYLTIPLQHLAYLSVVGLLVIGGVAYLLTGNWIVAVILALAALPVPMILVRLMKRARDRRFNVQLVDALMNMSNSLKAGFSLPQALELIAREMDNPISQEFRLLVMEMRLGVEMGTALENLLERMPSDDLDLVVTSVQISSEVGGALTQVFDNIAETIRSRQRIEGRIRALTAQGRMQGLIMCLLPFVVAGALHLISPTLIRPLFTTLPGGVIMGIIVVFELCGALWIRKIINIDV